MTGRSWRWTAPWRAHHRLLISLLLGIVAWACVPVELPLVTRGLFAGDIAGATLLALAMWLIMTSDVEETHCQAAAHDPGRALVWIVVLAVSATSLFAATSLLRVASQQASFERHFLTALTIATAAIAWLLTHVAFTLRYAHLYYRGRPEDEGGICFPGNVRPCNSDFAYFAFTLGMCFQVSDATITDRAIRRTVLGHALLSFAYNTGILALVLNIVVGQLV